MPLGLKMDVCAPLRSTGITVRPFAFDPAYIAQAWVGDFRVDTLRCSFLSESSDGLRVIPC